MLSNIFGTVLTGGEITAAAFAATTVCSLILGLVIAFLFSIKNKFSQSFLITLALLPAAVQLVIMLVNGNVGAGVAVMGAFSLVRFRSVPGSGQEITAIFVAMGVGLATGMGYLGIATLFAVLLSLVFLFLSSIVFGQSREERLLKITIPEDLDFDDVFEDVLDCYTSEHRLMNVATSSFGSLYKLTYCIVLNDSSELKAMIDDLRIRNGNLDISCGRPVANNDVL